MNKFVGLRFILSHGSFLQVVTTEELARSYIDGWINSRLSSAIGEVGTVTPAGKQSWAVLTCDIKGVHTFDLEQLQATQLTQPGRGPVGYSWPGKSGV